MPPKPPYRRLRPNFDILADQHDAIAFADEIIGWNQLVHATALHPVGGLYTTEQLRRWLDNPIVRIVTEYCDDDHTPVMIAPDKCFAELLSAFKRWQPFRVHRVSINGGWNTFYVFHDRAENGHKVLRAINGFVKDVAFTSSGWDFDATTTITVRDLAQAWHPMLCFDDGDTDDDIIHDLENLA